jgi:hypothetical protein
MRCVHAVRSEEAYAVDPLTRIERPVEGPMLCHWADATADGTLVGVPRWLQRQALAGHLLRYPDDCFGCPCFTPAKETP